MSADDDLRQHMDVATPIIDAQRKAYAEALRRWDLSAVGRERSQQQWHWFGSGESGVIAGLCELLDRQLARPVGRGRPAAIGCVPWFNHEGIANRLKAMPACIVMNKPRGAISPAAQMFHAEGVKLRSEWVRGLEDVAPARPDGQPKVVGPGERLGSSLGPLRVFGYRQADGSPLLHAKLLVLGEVYEGANGTMCRRRAMNLKLKTMAAPLRVGFTALLLTTAVLGGSAVSAAAAGTYSTTGTVNVRYGPSTGYGVITTEPSGAGFTLVCQWQGGTNVNGNATWDEVRFSNGVVGAVSDYWTTTPSFNSFAPNTGACPAITTQMQNAANWAIAEKNSPDPTWSDHFGHPWSGYCEQFAEQAEGFAFTFASAIDDYNWQYSNGRIHTDTNPPPGAQGSGKVPICPLVG